MKCSNCHSLRTQLLSCADSHQKSVITTDAQLIHNCRATKSLCCDCGSVFIDFDPVDRLLTFFALDYDISALQQDRPFIIDGKKVPRQALLNAFILEGTQQAKMTPQNCLEIACGNGAQLQYLREVFPKAILYGIDPSSDIGSSLRNRANVALTQGPFSSEHYRGKTFDLIIAHGILNRVPTFQTLVEIDHLTHEGSCLSINMVTLEQANYAPHIWDHTHVCLKEVLEEYLAALGWEILFFSPCTSNEHYFCKKTSARRSLLVSPRQIEQTKALFDEYIHYWDSMFARFEASTKTTHNALYGLGLYNSILINNTNSSCIDYVVNDYPASKSFFGRTVLTREQASSIKDLTLHICCREQYVDALVTQAQASKLQINILNPERVSVS